VLQRVEQRGRIEAGARPVGAAKERGDGVDGGQGLEVAILFGPEA
jgi:hypothetical protein